MRAPRPQQPVGKDMAAFRVGTQLDFVHGQEICAHPLGHRLDGADPVLRARRHDAFLARDQRHHRRPPDCDDAVIDLARQQPQRQADDPGAMAQHALDGIVGLARVGRAKDGRNLR